ncbi:MAG: adenylate/guanylate cyclase domain-containing protein, partial [Ignavibacteriaceae bacterium]
MNDVSIRMLAAIMFTDMVGYTALMQQDEAKAKEKRDRHRKVLEELVTSHQGRILQYYGDGTLSIFGSAIEAVNCAVEIQKELRDEPRIPLRIGIHSGDIVYEDEGVYGDGVNVASRIENISVSGGVLISEKVYDEIQNHPYLKAVYVGKHNLKNVKRPVKIFAITTEGLSVPTFADQPDVGVHIHPAVLRPGPASRIEMFGDHGHVIGGIEQHAVRPGDVAPHLFGVMFAIDGFQVADRNEFERRVHLPHRVGRQVMLDDVMMKLHPTELERAPHFVADTPVLHVVGRAL